MQEKKEKKIYYCNTEGNKKHSLCKQNLIRGLTLFQF